MGCARTGRALLVSLLSPMSLLCSHLFFQQLASGSHGAGGSSEMGQTPNRHCWVYSCFPVPGGLRVLICKVETHCGVT